MYDLSVAIVSYNTRDLLIQCLDTLVAAAADLRFEIIVVDNGSTDGTIAALADYQPAVTLIENGENRGFASANNTALARASAPVTLLLNSDAFMTPGVLAQALTLLNGNPAIGVVGVRLLNPDGSIQAEAGTFPSFWDDLSTSLGFDQFKQRTAFNAGRPEPVDWVHGACLFVRTAAAGTVGGLDERFFMYSEEVDWCRRFWKAGWEVWYIPDADIVHIGSASSRDDTRRRLALYQSRLGFRRRVDGPVASMLLWLLMLVGLAGRAILRPVAQRILRRRLGRQTAASDSALLTALLRVDPLSRWAAS